jgi:hypothetical protein
MRKTGFILIHSINNKTCVSIRIFSCFDLVVLILCSFTPLDKENIVMDSQSILDVKQNRYDIV